MLGAVATVAISSVLVGPAAAAPEFTEFSVNSSDSQAGAHPDLNVRFQLEDETNEEVVGDLTFYLPQGVFGNPGAIFKCEAADFANKKCQPGSQAGVSIVSIYEGTQGTVLGTAPIYNVKTIDEEETARLAFVAPTVDIPIGSGLGPQWFRLRTGHESHQHLADGCALRRQFHHLGLSGR